MYMTVKSSPQLANANYILDSSGELRMVTTTEKIKVTTSLCFPWLSVTEFISVRDVNDKEVDLIQDLSELEGESQHAIIESLVAASFMLTIVEIIDIKDEFEIRSWDVVTKQGSYKFQTPLDYWPQLLGKSSMIMRDVTGNIFYVENTSLLDEKSKKLLWPFMD